MEKLKDIKYIFAVLLGNAIYAIGIAAFVLPNHIVAGGTTGIGLTLEHYFHLPIDTVVLIFNVIMFCVGAVFLGKKFAFTTLLSTFWYPIILKICLRIPEIDSFTDDKLLATISGGLLIGVGIGMVIRVGASTGGMDIPPLVLNKKFGIPVSVSLYVFDFTILLLQMLYSDREQIIYGILMVLIYTVVLDKILVYGSSKTQVQIITEKYEEMNDAILQDLDRGATLFYAQTGYLKEERKVIMTVISNRELPKLNELVKKVDPEAFMVIEHVNEVKGRGFSLNKDYISENDR